MRATEASEAEDQEQSQDRVLQARDWALGGLLGALGVVIPIVFHAIGMGKVFLPMYLPIFALGLLSSWPVALVVGLATPLISGVLTGMPPLAPPIALLMACELGGGAAVTAAVRSLCRGVYPALVSGLVSAKIIGIVVLVTIGRQLGYEESVHEYAILSLLASWPGYVLLLTVLPGAVALVQSTSVLGHRRRGQ